MAENRCVGRSVAPGVQWELDAVLTPAPIIVETTLGIVIVGIAGWF